MNVWLGALLVLLGGAGGIVAGELYHVFTAHRRRRTVRDVVVDLSAAAARGELLHLDWDTPQPRLVVRLDFRRAQRTQRCDPDAGVHYHGGGDRCQCGERPNVVEDNA